jgi:hypothetical protein
MSEDTPDFSVDPDRGMIPPAKFAYNGHQVGIVSSSRMAADQAKNVNRSAGEVISQPPDGLERLKLVSRLIAVPESSFGDVNSSRR